MIKSIVKFSQLESRLDAEYYDPAYFRLINKLKKTQYITIGETVKKYNTGCAPQEYKTVGIPILKVRNFRDGEIDFANADYIGKDFFQKHPSAVLAKGDIILTTTGEGSIGKVDYFYDDCIAGIVPEVTKITVNDYYDSGYIYAFLASTYGKEQFMRFVNRATGQTHLYFKDLKNSVLLPDPPLKIQNEIGDSIRKSIEIKKGSDKKYREAQGLLNDYLSIEKDKFNFSKTFTLKFSQLEERFDGEFYQSRVLIDSPIFDKGTSSLGDIAKINMGKTPSKRSYTSQGVRILKVRDLTNKGIDWSENNRAFANLEVWERSEKAKVQEGDILLISAAHQAYYIGKELDIVFDIPEKYNKKLLAVAELLVVRSGQKINPYVLLWYLRTPIAYKFIQQLITGETSHLYPKDLVSLPIPKKLFDFKNAKKIETLTKESILLQKKSKQLLCEAKRKVEEMIERG